MNHPAVDADQQVLLFQEGQVPAQGGRGTPGKALQFAESQLLAFCQQVEDACLSFLSDHER
jgi:hypothetical protein